jgi:hypothetical protein
MTTHHAKCLCGAVTVRLTAPPIAVRACWCRLCQYLAAGSETVNVIFAADVVHIAGQLTDYDSTAESDNIMYRRFCPVCGTPMLSASEARPDRIIIRAGALEPRENLKPSQIIWTSQAPAWARLDPTIPQTPAQPPPVP